jgi:hypothetical protein
VDANLLDLNEDDSSGLLDDVPRWTVDLHMQFSEAEAPTPIDAVSQFLVSILYRDMREMTFTVRDRQADDDGPAIYVHEGRVYSKVDFDTMPRTAPRQSGKNRAS